jgi:hypothetical protein
MTADPERKCNNLEKNQPNVKFGRGQIINVFKTTGHEHPLTQKSLSAPRKGKVWWIVPDCFLIPEDASQNMGGPKKAGLQAKLNEYKRLHKESEREAESLKLRVEELEERLSMNDEHIQELNQQLTAVDLFCNPSNMITNQEIVDMAVFINDRVENVATLIANCPDFTGSYSKPRRPKDIPTSIISSLGQDTVAILQNLDGRNQSNRFLQIALQSCIIRDLVRRVETWWCHDPAVYGQLRNAYFSLWGRGSFSSLHIS